MELIALPDGPFRGIIANQLTEALAEMPGLGSEAWEAAKKKAAELIRKGVLSRNNPVGLTLTDAELDASADLAIEKSLRRVAEWIEVPGYPQAAAPRSAVLVVVERVKRWLQGRIPRPPGGAPR